MLNRTTRVRCSQEIRETFVPLAKRRQNNRAALSLDKKSLKQNYQEEMD
jgi:hypothetical protein